MKLEYGTREFNNAEFNITELIKEVIRKCDVMIQEKKISVEFDDTKIIKFVADEFYIEQVVTNYLTNAIKHSKEIDGQKRIKINVDEMQNDKIRVSVFNTGENISDIDLERIWKRFYKIDESRNREDGVEFYFELDK